MTKTITIDRDKLEQWLKAMKFANLYYEIDVIADMEQALATKQKWVGLTDEDIRPMCSQEWVFNTVKQWAEIIEAKLREKNT